MIDLQARIAQYLSDCKELKKKASPADGLLGFGHDPAKDPMHEVFYNEIEAAVNELAESNPSAADALAAAAVLLHAHDDHPDCLRMAEWMLTAVQGLALPLVRFLAPEDAARLSDEYDRIMPKRLRLPNQKKLGDALRKQAGNGSGGFAQFFGLW